MKKLVSVIAFSTIVLSSFNSCNAPQAEVKEISIESSNIKSKKTEVLAINKSEVTMKVDGMVCAMGCAQYIQDKVGGLNGIVDSKVNFEEGAATFVFDKTTTSPEDIETFINEMHEGQYKAKIADASKEANIENEEKTESKETITSTSFKDRFNISFPELFTYFIKHLR